MQITKYSRTSPLSISIVVFHFRGVLGFWGFRESGKSGFDGIFK